MPVTWIRIRIQGSSGSGSGLRFLAGYGSGYKEYGSETLLLIDFKESVPGTGSGTLQYFNVDNWFYFLSVIFVC